MIIKKNIINKKTEIILIISAFLLHKYYNYIKNILFYTFLRKNVTIFAFFCYNKI